MVEDQEFMAKALVTKFYSQSLTHGHPESSSNIRVPKLLWEKPPNAGVTTVYHCLAHEYTRSQKASVMMHTRCVHLGRVVVCHNCNRTYYNVVDWVTHCTQHHAGIPKDQWVGALTPLLDIVIKGEYEGNVENM